MGPLTEARAVAGPNEKRAEPSTPERASKEMWMGSAMTKKETSAGAKLHLPNLNSHQIVFFSITYNQLSGLDRAISEAIEVRPLRSSMAASKFRSSTSFLSKGHLSC